MEELRTFPDPRPRRACTITHRRAGISYEAVSNAILDDLVAALEPVSISVEGTLTSRPQPRARARGRG